MERTRGGEIIALCSTLRLLACLPVRKSHLGLLLETEARLHSGDVYADMLEPSHSERPASDEAERSRLHERLGFEEHDKALARFLARTFGCNFPAVVS
jgi:hypothetical protein